MKTFIVADWHLGETRLNLMGRPFINDEHMIKVLINEHNKLVSPADSVIVVGDICYQKTPEKLKLISEFNGNKILIRGNHDRVFEDDQLYPYFNKIIPDGKGMWIDVNGICCYIVHYPTMGVKDCFNLVGHVHSAWKYQLNMFNVGIDVNNFRPVDLDTIPFHLNAISNYYDEDVWVSYNEINTSYRTIRGKAGSYFVPKV